MLIQVTRARSAIASLPVICAMQQEQEVDRDAGEVRQHEDRRGDQPQPAIQPTHGPKARAAQVNEVPESGIRRLSSR